MISFLLISMISNAQTKWTNASVPVGVCAERVGQVLNLKEVRPKDRTDPFSGKKIYRYDRPGFCDFAEVIDSGSKVVVQTFHKGRGCEYRKEFSKKKPEKGSPEDNGDLDFSALPDGREEGVAFVFSKDSKDCVFQGLQLVGKFFNTEVCRKIQGYESTWSTLEPYEQQDVLESVGLDGFMPEDLVEPLISNCGSKRALAYQLSVKADARATVRSASPKGGSSAGSNSKSPGTLSGTRAN